MYLILFRRELLANLMTLRFLVVVITCLLLVVVTPLYFFKITNTAWMSTTPP